MAQSSILNPQFSQGFSLVSAIFLLVVIAALGAFAVTLSTTQQQSAALDVMGVRAYQAARAGIEWGAFQVLRNPGVAGGFAANCLAGPTAQPLAALPNTLAAFTVTVACASTSHIDAGVGFNMYQLTSTASAVVDTGSVERQLSVSIAAP